MTEIASAKLTNGTITEELGVYDLDSELHIICLDYDIMSPGSSTHHTTRLTYAEAWKLAQKIQQHILHEAKKEVRKGTLDEWMKQYREQPSEGGDICESER